MKKETPEEALVRLLEEAGAKLVDCTPRKQIELGIVLPKKVKKYKKNVWF